MESYMLSVFILSGIIILKLGIIICLYTFRVYRLKKIRQLNAQNNGTGASAYPQQQYNQSSAIVNYEEMPATVSHVSGNEFSSGTNYLQPPSYNEVVPSQDDKPPSYEQVVALPSTIT